MMEEMPSSPNTITSTFISSITNDGFKESARLVHRAVENMKVTPSNRDLLSSFPEREILRCQQSLRTRTLSRLSLALRIHQATVTAPKTIGLTYEEVTIDASNA